MDAQTKRLLQQKTIEAIKAPDSDRTLRPTSLLTLAGIIAVRGSTTSGNWNHRSVKGKHGGSSPGGGHKRIGIRSGDDPAAIGDKVAEHRFEQERLRKRRHERQTSSLKTIQISSTDELDPFQKGAQESIVIEFEDDSRAIAKPDQGIEEFGHSTAHAERLSFETAQQLGYGDLVPETVVRDDIPDDGGRSSSVQRWVENAETYADLQERIRAKGPLEPPPPSLTQQTRNMLVLDYVIDNGDRHDFNMMIDENDKLWAIDHGFAYRQTAEITRTFGGQQRIQGRFWALTRGRYRELWNESRPGVKRDNQDPFTLTDQEKGAMRGLQKNKKFLDEIEKHLGGLARHDLESRLNSALEEGAIPL